MVALRFERVLALPSPATANTIYFVRPMGAEVALQYVTGNDGVPVLVGGGNTPTPTPTPAPVFTTQPSITGTAKVGQAVSALTFADGTVADGTITARAYLLAGTSVALSYVFQNADLGKAVTFRNTATGAAGSMPAIATSAAVTVQPADVTPTPAPSLPASYSQTMGATTSDGWIIMPALKNDGVARRIFVDSVNGNDANNGLSPYQGFRGNGTGNFFQIGASGQGTTDTAYGPKKTLQAAFAVLPKLNYTQLNPGIGHRIMLAEGGTYVDPSAETDGFKAIDHYGESITSPFAIHSYAAVEPWNNSRYGRAVGSARPKIQLPANKALSWGSFVDGSYGLISNFMYVGLAFVGPSGARLEEGMIWGFSSTDAENILIENCDMGAVRFVEENKTYEKGTAHWSKNLVIRRCLFDHGYNLVGNQPAIFMAYVCGQYIEDSSFNHCSWIDAADGRYVAEGGATVLRHDVYNSGAGQFPMVYRRNVSVDPAATSLSNRNNSVAYHNWVIDAPIGLISAGGVGNAGLAGEQPNGNWFDHHHNFIMGSAMLFAPQIVFSDQPVPGSTFVRIANIEIEFVDAGQPATTGRMPVAKGGNLSGTIDNLAAFLNAKTDALTSRVTYFNFGGTTLREAPKTQGGAFTWVEAYGPNVSAPDPGYRGWAYAAANGVQGATMRDSLIVNSGFSANTGNAPNAYGLYVAPGRTNGTSYITFSRNRLFDFGPSREGVVQSGTVQTHIDNTYSATSPHSNDEVYAALGFASKSAFIAALVARFEEPWALRALDVAAPFWNHSFAIPDQVAPVVSTPASVDKAAPMVGDTLTFTPPASNGTIVSATTYTDMHPIPGTGKDVNTLALTSDHQGKRISRIWVIASNTGGLPTSVLVEVPNLVAASASLTPPNVTSARLVTDENANPGSRNFTLRIKEFWFEKGDGTIVRPSWAGRRDDSDHNTDLAIPELSDNNLGTLWASPGIFEVGALTATGTFPAAATVTKFVVVPESPNAAPGKWRLYLTGTGGEVKVIDMNEPDGTNWTNGVARTFVLP